MLNTSKAYAVQIGMSSPFKERIIKVHRENIQKSLTWKNFEQKWIEPPAIGRLREIKSSTLFIVGTEDKKDLFRIKALFSQVSNVIFKDVENADHVLTWTHSKELLTAIREFIN